MKKGVAPIVAVAILVGLVVGLAGIFYSFASPLVTETMTESDIRQRFNSEVIDLSSVTVDTGTKTVEFAIRRGNTQLADIVTRDDTAVGVAREFLQLIFTDTSGDSSTQLIEANVPGGNEVGVFTIDLSSSGISVSDLEKVDLYLGVRVAGKPIVSEVLDSHSFS